jgi:hypothetical protein
MEKMAEWVKGKRSEVVFAKLSYSFGERSIHLAQLGYAKNNTN